MRYARLCVLAAYLFSPVSHVVNGNANAWSRRRQAVWPFRGRLLSNSPPSSSGYIFGSLRLSPPSLVYHSIYIDRLYLSIDTFLLGEYTVLQPIERSSSFSFPIERACLRACLLFLCVCFFCVHRVWCRCSQRATRCELLVARSTPWLPR